jgi:tRNA dimethylallyltransferase
MNLSLKTTIDSFLEKATNPLLVILGPTASGKTKIALDLAEQYQGEIISADSRQIYKYLDVGTAKITKKESRGIPHYMIDIIEPDQPFSVSEYKKQAEQYIKAIHQRKKLPILVGGTGLYIDSIVYDFTIPPPVQNKKIRQQLEQELLEKGTLFMHQKLKELDPEAGKKIHPHNRHHLIRALSVVLTTGKSKFTLAQKNKSKYNVLLIGLAIPRAELYLRINQRVRQMFEQGLIAETKNISKKGYNLSLPALTSIGYQEINLMLQGRLTEAEAIAKIQQKTRNYAKRQTTWFKKNKEILWINFS